MVYTLKNLKNMAVGTKLYYDELILSFGNQLTGIDIEQIPVKVNLESLFSEFPNLKTKGPFNIDDNLQVSRFYFIHNPAIGEYGGKHLFMLDKETNVLGPKFEYLGLSLDSPYGSD